MFTCPHCEERGVGAVDKVLSHPVYPATCRLCGEHSTKSAKVVWLQLGLALGFLAVVPNLCPPDTVKVLGAGMACVIVLVGLAGPLRRHSA